MKSPASFTFVILVALMLFAGATGFALQRKEAHVLRGELELARSEARDLDSLRAQNQQLRSQQIPASELEQLRADHAALARLRVELESLQKRE